MAPVGHKNQTSSETHVGRRGPALRRMAWAGPETTPGLRPAGRRELDEARLTGPRFGPRRLGFLVVSTEVVKESNRNSDRNPLNLPLINVGATLLNKVLFCLVPAG